MKKKQVKDNKISPNKTLCSLWDLLFGLPKMVYAVRYRSPKLPSATLHTRKTLYKIAEIFNVMN